MSELQEQPVTASDITDREILAFLDTWTTGTLGWSMSRITGVMGGNEEFLMRPESTVTENLGEYGLTPAVTFGNAIRWKMIESGWRPKAATIDDGEVLVIEGLIGK